HLMDAIRLNGEKEELKKEIVALAKEFGVMTKYTSWLVLEDAARSPRPETAGGGRLRGADNAIRELEEARKEAGGPPDADFGAALKKDKGEDALEMSEEAKDQKAGKVAAGDPAPGSPFRRQDAQGRDRSAIQVVGGKTFFSTSEGWFDQKFGDKMETLKVEYLSDEYFKLLKEKPELGRYFALGNRVVVVLGDKAYEVVPAVKK
ncbi:MAG: hypothetical protein HYY18_01840, partial [Planctomycetes bacterium]|nr:hypothetical protein [Planctomycetota bacterium]